MGILVRDLHFSYGDSPVLSGVSIEAGAGESVAVLGPSGCGKTTLVKILAGLLEPGRGRVLVGGREARRGRADVAIIFQELYLLPWYTAARNVALGLVLRGVSWAEAIPEARRVLGELGLGGWEDRYPWELSGGMRQRVALARALATEPRVLLMDEPFSSLDALTREAMQDLVARIWRRRGVTLLLTTHSVEEAAFLAQRIYVLSARPARVVAFFDNPGAGTPGYRETGEYASLVSEVRRAVRGAAAT